MNYNREYHFFKNLALRMQIPVSEINQEELSLFFIMNCGNLHTIERTNYDELYHLFQTYNENEIIHLENFEEDANCLFYMASNGVSEKIIILGPFAKKDIRIAYGLILEFAETISGKQCRIQTYNFSVKKMHPVVESIVQSINEEIGKEYSLRHVASRMHVSPGHLSKLFSTEMGMTLTEYVNRKKIAYGAYLLSTTDEKITSVAFACGIKDNNYFSRLFKKFMGVSPVEYRKKGSEA